MVGDWWYAFRVAALGEVCHRDTDKNSRKAEVIIENIIAERFARMGLTDFDIKRILLECAEEVKREYPDLEYVVEF